MRKILSRAVFVVATMVTLISAVTNRYTKPLFSQEERSYVLSLWAEQCKYECCPLEPGSDKGLWQVRLTPEGSTWLWQYNKARDLGKVNPNVDAGAQNPEQQEWEKWIDAKISYDQVIAFQEMAQQNAKANGTTCDQQPELPEMPPMPEGLAKLMGPEVPVFSQAVLPNTYFVQIEKEEPYEYLDQVPMRARYAYFRSANGVMSGGTRVKELPENEIEGLLKEAGISESEANIFRAVSMLEGGFDSVNTYDTGFLSVGFIQFAALQQGGGSLGQVLLTHKQEAPISFERDFRRFGIDVNNDGLIVALDPETGQELLGPYAVRKIIDDKRLTTVFKRAGQISRDFRLAQLKVAKDKYYPADDEIKLKVGDKVIVGKVSDFVKSEAGMAILMDRKVNTGKLTALIPVLSKIIEENKIQKLEELAPYERMIVSEVRFRKDYLQDMYLTQPGESPIMAGRDTGVDATRGGDRSKKD